MSNTGKRVFETAVIVFLSMMAMVLLLRISDDSLLKGGSGSVIQSESQIADYISNLRDYKGKTNLSTKVGIKFDVPCNDYRQSALRAYYNTVADKGLKIYGDPGTCWSSAILSSYLTKDPASYRNYKNVAAEILKNAILRKNINVGLLHSESRAVLNNIFEIHKVPAVCKSWSSYALGSATTGAKYFEKIKSERGAGNVALFSVPGHEMAAVGYCSVQVRWKEGTEIKTKFEDMILVCDTWHDRENVTNDGKPIRKRSYSFFPVREMAYGLYYNLSIVKSK